MLSSVGVAPCSRALCSANLHGSLVSYELLRFLRRSLFKDWKLWTMMIGYFRTEVRRLHLLATSLLELSDSFLMIRGDSMWQFEMCSITLGHLLLGSYLVSVWRRFKGVNLLEEVVFLGQALEFKKNLAIPVSCLCFLFVREILDLSC